MLDSGDYVTIDDLTYSYEGKQTRLTAQKKRHYSTTICLCSLWGSGVVVYIIRCGLLLQVAYAVEILRNLYCVESGTLANLVA